MTEDSRTKRLARYKRYRESTKGRDRQARYENTPERRAWKLRYRQSPHGKAIQNKSQRTDKARIRRMKYRHSPAGRKSANKYRHTIKGKAKYAKGQRNYAHKLKQQILDLLGRSCARCGFSDPRALQIDHIKGGGVAERKRLGTTSMYRKILTNTTPGEYQILCANCNWIKRSENETEHDTRNNKPT